jgi:hypothetical protein
MPEIRPYAESIIFTTPRGQYRTALGPFKVKVRSPRNGEWIVLPSDWDTVDEAWDATRSYRNGDEPAAEVVIFRLVEVTAATWNDQR